MISQCSRYECQTNTVIHCEQCNSDIKLAANVFVRMEGLTLTYLLKETASIIHSHREEWGHRQKTKMNELPQTNRLEQRLICPDAEIKA